jgi:monovalent cation/hydrogen antiporter
VTYRIALTAAALGTVSWQDAVGQFIVSAAGGALIGLVLGWLIAALRKRLDDSLLENTLSLLTPFAAYLPAEALHVSGVLAVVAAGLYLGRHHPVLLSSATRLQWLALWRMITFLLEGVVFALIGLQLPAILDGLRGSTAGALAAVVLAVTATVIVVRILWLFGVEYGLRNLVDRLRRVSGRGLPWQYPAVISWAGMRGVVSLAAAFALPTELPGRDLVLVVTFCVILATLVLQGLSLPWTIRRLDLEHGGDAAERAEHDAALADHHVARTALAELEDIDDEEPLPEPIKEGLRRPLEERVRRAHAILGGCPGEDEYHHVPIDGDPVAEAQRYRDLRRRLLGVERAELVRLYRAGDINDEVLRRIQHRLDFEEIPLTDQV